MRGQLNHANDPVPRINPFDLTAYLLKLLLVNGFGTAWAAAADCMKPSIQLLHLLRRNCSRPTQQRKR